MSRLDTLELKIKRDEYKDNRKHELMQKIMNRIIHKTSCMPNQTTSINTIAQIIRKYALQNMQLHRIQTNLDKFLRVVLQSIQGSNRTSWENKWNSLLQIINQYQITFKNKQNLIHEKCQDKLSIKPNQINQILIPNSNGQNKMDCHLLHTHNGAYLQHQSKAVLNIELDPDLFKLQFKRKLCAILNHGGGYLIIEQQHGKQKERQNIRSLDGWIQYYIKEIKHCIFPRTYHIAVQQVPAYNKARKQIRYKILPSCRTSIFFWYQKIDKRTSRFKYCQLDNEKEDEKLLSLKNSSHFYNIIMSKYNKYQPFKHKVCSINIANQHHFVSDFRCLFLGNNRHKYSSFKVDDEEINDGIVENQCVLYSQPEISYKHQSVIILSSQQDDELIQKTEKYLHNEGLANFIFVKPYKSYRTNSLKSIWHCSHEDQLSKFKSYIQEVESRQKKGKKGEKGERGEKALKTMIEVTKYIEIRQVGEEEEKKLWQLRKTFKCIFGWQIKWMKQKVKDKNNDKSNKWNVYMRLKLYQESQFIFLYLDNLRIRVKFIKQTPFQSLERQLTNIGSIHFAQII